MERGTGKSLLEVVAEARVPKSFLAAELLGKLGLPRRWVESRDWGSLPLGRWFVDWASLADDARSRHGLADLREKLKTDGVMVLFAHHDRWDAQMVGKVITEALEIGVEKEDGQYGPVKKVVIPVAYYLWADDQLREEFFGLIADYPGVEMFPVIREKEKMMVEKGELVLRDKEGNVLEIDEAIRYWNEPYMNAVSEAVNEPGSLVFVATGAERTPFGQNSPEGGVLALLLRKDPWTMPVATVAAPHGVLGLLDKKVRLWEKSIKIMELIREERETAGGKQGRWRKEQIQEKVNQMLGELEEADKRGWKRKAEYAGGILSVKNNRQRVGQVWRQWQNRRVKNR